METNAVRELDAYLRREISLRELRDRLSDLTWDNPDAPAFAHKIEHVIDEAASGNLTVADMNDALTRLSVSEHHLVRA